MAEWEISLAPIHLMPHPNADSLELAEANGRQFVVQKGLYTEGDFVIVVPEKSLLPENLAVDFRPYLKGKEQNRVGITKLRGEISEGVLLNPAKVLGRDAYTPDFDFSNQGLAEFLGITEYIPPIPKEMEYDAQYHNVPLIKHDCSQFSIDRKIASDEHVLVTEKIHGSQINIGIELYDDEVVETELVTKRYVNKGISIKEKDTNVYWRAFYSLPIHDLVLKHFTKPGERVNVQIVGEVVPVFPGYNYGLTSPTILIYRILVNNRTLRYYDEVPDDFKKYWVPVLMQCKKSDAQAIKELAEKDTHMNNAKHAMEGVVVSSIANPERYLKYISNRYAKKQTGEEFN